MKGSWRAEEKGYYWGKGKHREQYEGSNSKTFIKKSSKPVLASREVRFFRIIGL